MKREVPQPGNRFRFRFGRAGEAGGRARRSCAGMMPPMLERKRDKCFPPPSGKRCRKVVPQLSRGCSAVVPLCFFFFGFFFSPGGPWRYTKISELSRGCPVVVPRCLKVVPRLSRGCPAVPQSCPAVVPRLSRGGSSLFLFLLIFFSPGGSWRYTKILELSRGCPVVVPRCLKVVPL